MADDVRVVIHGAGGRMGQRLIALARQDAGLTIVGAVDSAKSPVLGRDAGEVAGIGPIGVPITSTIPDNADVVIDFSVPEAAAELAEICHKRKLKLVAATTGLNDGQKEKIRAVATQAAVVWSPSMSTAVNIAMKLVQQAARAVKSLPSGVDVEIVERHHRFKQDAPSGTALKFGQIVQEEMGQTEARHGREGQVGKRPHGEIGYHAVRTGDNVGEHTIIFGMMGETLEVYVRGHTRDSYAYGALAAAKWLADKPAGLYGMADVLGLADD